VETCAENRKDDFSRRRELLDDADFDGRVRPGRQLHIRGFTRTPADGEEKTMTESMIVPSPPVDDVRPRREDDQIMDMTDEWGMQSFPASDPPQNW
jgi:hypothetical protein